MHALFGQSDDAGHIPFLLMWGEAGTAPGQFDFPIDIVITSANELLITDYFNNRIQKFDSKGQRLAHFPVIPNPGAIALDDDGNIYVTHFRASTRSEHHGDLVSVYNPDGMLLRQWGRTGKGDGDFDCPGGIVIAKDGRVYIADQTNHRVQVFDCTGRFLFKWGSHGNEPGQFGGHGPAVSRTAGPQFVALDSAGNLWTTEGANCRIQAFTSEGKHLLDWGGSEDQPGGFGGLFTGFKDRDAGSLHGPIALCFDSRDCLWVSAVSGRIQQFTREGKYLRGLVEGQGSGPSQFYAPHGLVFDRAGCLYVVDSFNHRIQKFNVVGPCDIAASDGFNK